MSVTKKIIIYWLPVVLWAAFIFYLSSQSYPEHAVRPFMHKAIPEQTVLPHSMYVDVAYSDHHTNMKQSVVPKSVDFFKNKYAHLSVYLVLGMLLIRAFLATSIHKILAVVLSLLLCFLFANSDEIRQIFTQGRTPLLLNVLLDSSGSLIGILIGFFIFSRQSNRTASKNQQSQAL